MARTAQSRIACGFLSGNLLEQDHLEDLSVDGKITINGLIGRGIGWRELFWSNSGQYMWQYVVDTVMILFILDTNECTLDT